MFSVVIIGAAVVDVCVVMRMQKIESHDDRQHKDAESKYDGCHSPALSLTRCLHSTIVIPLPVEPMYLDALMYNQQVCM